MPYFQQSITLSWQELEVFMTLNKQILGENKESTNVSHAAIYIYCHFGNRLPGVYQDFRLKTNQDHELLAYICQLKIKELNVKLTFVRFEVGLILSHPLPLQIFFFKDEHLLPSPTLHFNLRKINYHKNAAFPKFANGLLAISEHLHCLTTSERS